MAHIKFSTTEEEKEFYEQLPNGIQLRFTFSLDPDNPDYDPEEVLIPRVIATALSVRIHDLYLTFLADSDCDMATLATNTAVNAWAADSLVGVSQENFEELMGVKASYGLCMKSFTIWACTGKILLGSLHHFKVWRFAQIIGAPGFMNAILRDLCSPDGEAEHQFKSEHPLNTMASADVRLCWAICNFEHEDQQEIMMKVAWDTKTMLKLMIEIFAYKAVHLDGFKNNEELKDLLGGHDQIAMQVMRAVGRTEEKAVQTAPWHADNPEDYMVFDEPGGWCREGFYGIESKK